jgi:hypothetical protein
MLITVCRHHRRFVGTCRDRGLGGNFDDTVDAELLTAVQRIVWNVVSKQRSTQ